MKNNKLKKVIGFISMGVVVLLMGCNEPPVAEEVIVEPTETIIVEQSPVEAEAPVVVEKAPATKEAATKVELSESGIDLKTDKIDLSIKK